MSRRRSKASEPTGAKGAKGGAKGAPNAAEDRAKPVTSRRAKRWGLLLLVACAAVGATYWIRSSGSALIQAKAALARHDMDAASEHLDAAIASGADEGEVAFLRARVARRRGDLRTMQQRLAEAWEADFDVERLEREQHLAMAQSGQLAEALPHLAEMLTDPQGDASEICEAYINGYFGSHQFADAMPLIEGWQADFPKDAQPYLYLGLYHRHMTDFAKAEQDYRRGSELAPSRLDFRQHLAEVLFELQRYEDCLNAIQAAKELESDNPDMETLRGTCLFRFGQVDQARTALAAVLNSAPDHWKCRIALGQLEAEAGNSARVVELCEPVVKERPWELAARKPLASALRKLGQRELAAEHFAYIEAAIESTSRVSEWLAQLKHASPQEEADLRCQIGVELLKYDNPEEGAGWVSSVFNIDPDHPAAHRALADYYEQRGDLATAAAHRSKLAPAGDGS